jgi:hypothetical protein
MPTKRQRIGRNRTQKTVQSLLFTELMAFEGGWTPLSAQNVPWRDNPEQQARQLWQSWREFLSDWEAVRDDWARQDPPPGGTPFEETFAERLYQQYGVDGPSVVDRLSERG